MNNDEDIEKLAKHYMALRDFLVLFSASFQAVLPQQATLVSQVLDKLLSQNKNEINEELLNLSKTIKEVLSGNQDIALLSQNEPHESNPQHKSSPFLKLLKGGLLDSKDSPD
jgi:hypothetical protein